MNSRRLCLAVAFFLLLSERRRLPKTKYELRPTANPDPGQPVEDLHAFLFKHRAGGA